MNPCSRIAAGFLLLLGLAAPAATMTNSTATLTGLANPGGIPTMYWFEWGPGQRFDQSTPVAGLGAGNTPVAFSEVLSNLTPGLTYRSRSVISNALLGTRRGFPGAFLSPVATLLGANPLTNTWGLAYVEPGATADGFPVALAGGRAHSLALKADGRLVCWGDNFYRQTNSPATATNLIAVAAGQNHSVALRANGTVLSWGDNSSGQTNVAASATNVIAIAAGESFCLALRTNGTVVGWGDSFYGQTNAPANLTNAIALATGQRHCLALRNDATVTAWGYNGFNQTNVPMDATNILVVAAGAGHSLVLKSDRTILAWGLNSYFQTNLPGNATNVIAIAAGFYHNLALRADGTVIGWGAGTNNTGTIPHFGQAQIPPTLTNIIAIAAGYYNSYALKADGSVLVWGAGASNTGFFPNNGQAIVPAGLNSLNLPFFVGGTVNPNLTGNYPLSYAFTNAFGGVGTTTRSVTVTDPPPPPALGSFSVVSNGQFQFTFTNATPINFTVLASTNIALPASNWIVLGPAAVLAPGAYQFTDAQATNFPQRFYQVRSP